MVVDLRRASGGPGSDPDGSRRGGAINPVDRTVNSIAARWADRTELTRLRVAPWSDPDAMDELRLRRLRATLERARRRSPFWSSKLKGIELPRSLADVAELPFTTKDEVRASVLERAAPGLRRAWRPQWSTSGTSGSPYRFDVDLGYASRHSAQQGFVFEMSGAEPGALVVVLTSKPARPSSGSPIGPFRRAVVPIAGAEPMLDALRRLEPQVVFLQRSMLAELFDRVEESGEPWHVPLVCNTGERIHPLDEARAGAILGARVSEIYGSAECGNLAFRRPDRIDWEIIEPRALVEVIAADGRPAAAGELGEIVVTTLTEPISAMVRYRTGDMATVSHGDGRGGSGMGLRSLDGRENDLVIDAQGRPVSYLRVAPGAFWGSTLVTENVREWRIHQRSDRSIEVILSARPGGDPAPVADAARRHLARVLPGLRVDVVERVMPHGSRSGKFRAVTSDAVPEQAVADPQ